MRDTWILMLGLSTVWACSLLGQNGCFYELSPLRSQIYTFSGLNPTASYTLAICEALSPIELNVSATQQVIPGALFELGRLPAILSELAGPPPANGSAVPLFLHRLSLNAQKYAQVSTYGTMEGATARVHLLKVN